VAQGFPRLDFFEKKRLNVDIVIVAAYLCIALGCLSAVGCEHLRHNQLAATVHVHLYYAEDGYRFVSPYFYIAVFSCCSSFCTVREAARRYNNIFVADDGIRVDF